jgi:hypothetical protein
MSGQFYARLILVVLQGAVHDTGQTSKKTQPNRKSTTRERPSFTFKLRQVRSIVPTYGLDRCPFARGADANTQLIHAKQLGGFLM